jgi:predicted TIM-barrel fold metal-dependent hydrolase
VSIFARELTDDLAGLVKQIDEQVSKNEEKKMAAFVVILSEDSDTTAEKLEELAKKQGIKNVPLTIFDGEAGPGDYKIAKDADVTVLMWKGLEVKANHAFKPGELNGEKAKTVLQDTSKILE